MHIVFVLRSVTRSAGGLLYAPAGLARGLVAQGHRVTVVGGGDETLWEDRTHWGSDIELVIKRTGFYGFDRELLRAVRLRECDVVHVHGIWSGASVMGRLVPRHRPIVLSPHGMLDPWILKRNKVKKATHSTLFEKPLMRRSVIHALCDSEAESCASYMPSIKDRIFVVPNGIDPPTRTDVDVERKSGTLYLGRLHEKKQVHELVEAWKKGPATRKQNLTIAGYGEPAYEVELRRLIADEPTITFVGSAFGKAKENLLAKARYFILPSLSEGLPMAVLEGLSYGAIPVITRHCNLPELINDGIAIEISASLSELDSVYAHEYSRDNAEREEHARKCLSRANDYHWNAIAERMRPAYEAAIALRA